MNAFTKNKTTKAICTLAGFLLTALSLVSLKDLQSFHSRRKLINEVVSHKFYAPDDEEQHIVPTSERKKSGDLRYATFGSSVTWGAGIADRNNSYAHLLSPNVANHAIRANGPMYPANCLYSMIGDDEYDVIILEFFLMAHSGLEKLALRLRQRFPDAIIIILQNWFPLMINTAGKDGDPPQNIAAWAEKKGFVRQRAGLHDKNFQKLFTDAAPEENWQWSAINDLYFIRSIEKFAKAAGAYISYMPRPHNAKDWINFDQYIANDGTHLSEIGHLNVLRRIQEIVDRVGVPSSPQVAKFSYKDSCHTWFESGDASSISISDNGVVEKMPNTLKYALSFPQNEHGHLHLENPSEEAQALYLGYMTTGPPPSKYPKGEVKICKAHTHSCSRPVVLDPSPPTGFGGAGIHVQKIADIGDIPSGNWSIRFRALEEKERPFRIVSVVMTKRTKGGGSFDKYSSVSDFNG